MVDTSVSALLGNGGTQKVIELPEGTLTIDGHANALVGIVTRMGQEPIACYSYDRIILNLMEDMDRESAIEFFEFNIIGSWVGERTPCFIEEND